MGSSYQPGVPSIPGLRTAPGPASERPDGRVAAPSAATDVSGPLTGSLRADERGDHAAPSRGSRPSTTAPSSQRACPPRPGRWPRTTRAPSRIAHRRQGRRRGRPHQVGPGPDRPRRARTPTARRARPATRSSASPQPGRARRAAVAGGQAAPRARPHPRGPGPAAAGQPRASRRRRVGARAVTVPSATRRTRLGTRPAGRAGRGGDDGLAGRQVGQQGGRALGVELGEHVVEQEQRRRCRAGGDAPVRGQAQGQGERCAARPATRGCGPAARRGRCRARRGGGRPGSRPAAARRAGPRRGRPAARRDATAGRSAGRPRRRRPGRGRPPSTHRAEPSRPGPSRASARASPACGEPGVPHVEGGLDLRRQPAAGLLEQRVALAQDPVEVGAQRVDAGVEGDQQVVEVAAPLPRAALHQLEVVGREHHRPQGAEQVAGPAQRLPVDQRPAPATGRDLALDQQRPLAPRAPRPARRPGRRPTRTRASVGAPRNERSVPSQPMASSRLVLPWPLAPTTAVRPGREGDLGRRRSCGSRSARAGRGAPGHPAVGRRRAAAVRSAPASAGTGTPRARWRAATAGLLASIVSRAISSPGATSMPSSRYSGLKPR